MIRKNPGGCRWAKHVIPQSHFDNIELEIKSSLHAIMFESPASRSETKPFLALWVSQSSKLSELGGQSKHHRHEKRNEMPSNQGMEDGSFLF